jgi:hypothetical protein
MNQEVIKNIQAIADELASAINGIADDGEKISILNQVRETLHQVSPLKHHPVDFVKWEKSESVEANEYNPNSVAPPEMRLLIKSIQEDGYTMPIVTFPDEETIRIIDGFHRRKSERINAKIHESTMGYIPISTTREHKRAIGDRMASTIRHNRARGSHNVELMSSIVVELVEMGKSDNWICKHVGMSADELLRLKQITGLAALFKDREFSKAWE